MKKIVQSCIACSVIVAVALAAGCSKDGGSYYDSAGSSGKGGSMARFAIVGDWLYTVDHTWLNVVSLSDPSRPIDTETPIRIGADIETIFPVDTLLFIGSQSGMYIYNIKRPEFPKHISTSFHFRSCDPVVAADTLAFVTLNSSLGNWCGQTTQNLLQVYDIKDLRFPKLLKEVAMSSPRGLAVDIGQKMLFVCDNGIKAYDITDPRDPEIMYSELSVGDKVGRIDAYDCIVWEGKLLVIGAAGLYQFGYDSEKFTFISKIDLREES